MQSVPDVRPWLNFYPKEVSNSKKYPDDPLQSFLIDSASKFPNSVAIEFQGKKISYKQLNELSNQFANGLISLGLRSGSKIAIILPNTPQFVFCFFGALKAGAVVVPCNPLYRERELEFQLQDSETEAVIILNNIYHPTDFYAEFEKARPRLGRVQHVFVTSLLDFLPPIKKQLAGPVKKIQTLKKPDTTNLIDFVNRQSKSEPSRLTTDAAEEVAVLQYTGGTTGISKGAMLTHKNLSSNAIMLMDWINATHDEKVLAVTPFFHIYGLTVGMTSPIYVGQEIVVLPSFRAGEVLETIHKQRITIFPRSSHYVHRSTQFTRNCEVFYQYCQEVRVWSSSTSD